MPITIQRAPLPSLIQRLAEPRRFVQVVAGPRQVGKTTLVRRALAGWRRSRRGTGWRSTASVPMRRAASPPCG